MAILEKFKYYKELLVYYITTRFNVIRYAVFSLLLLMLAKEDFIDTTRIARELAFIFLTLFVFRWIDDAASFRIDRFSHQERRYLEKGNFKHFLYLGGVIVIVYLTVAFLISGLLGWSISGLLLISAALYIPFHRSRELMIFIPPLKYPVIFWIISGFSLSVELACLSLSVYLLLLTVDLFEKKESRFPWFMYRTVLLLIIAFLIIQPWSEVGSIGWDLFLILLPILVLNIPAVNRVSYSPVILFPLLHIIDLFI